MRKIIFLLVLFSLAMGFLLFDVSHLVNEGSNAFEPTKKVKVDDIKVNNFFNQVKKSEWIGVASFYGPGFQGKSRADGKRYDMYQVSVAHRFLPFGTKLRITNLSDWEMPTVIAKVNDRGPYIIGRELDLSLGAAKKLKMVRAKNKKIGLILVKIEVLS